MSATTKLPSRLHHNAYVTSDMEATRKFYEDVLGLPLVATWSESDDLFGAVRVFVHCFFGIADGSALAFFQFANSEDQALFGPKMPEAPFHHIALKVDDETQEAIEGRLKAAGYREPKFFSLEHGYCRSIYVTDPNGLVIEFARDRPDIDKINKARQADAHEVLARWLNGDQSSNNMYR